MTISIETLSFLKELKDNNNREWFTDNKNRYEAAQSNHLEFVDALLNGLRKIDPNLPEITAKGASFRIYRDVRFSKDKSPYKTNMGAYASPNTHKGEIHAYAGYYFHLESEESFMGGGAYNPDSQWIKAIRQEIDYNGVELLDIVNNPKFKAAFSEIKGEKLKRTPKEYDESNKYIEWLKLKSFLATRYFSDEEVTATSYLENLLENCQTLKPFLDFLNRSGH